MIVIFLLSANESYNLFPLTLELEFCIEALAVLWWPEGPHHNLAACCCRKESRAAPARLSAAHGKLPEGEPRASCMNLQRGIPLGM
jgi:hypothetical protein